MKSSKRLGVWIDHNMAHLIELENDSIKSKTVESLFLEGKDQTFGMNEILKQNTKQELLSAFFKSIRAISIDYPDLIIFGPTHTKTAFYSFLKKDMGFYNIKIEVATTGYLTENQRLAFVEEYFKTLDDDKKTRIVSNHRITRTNSKKSSSN